MNAFEQLFERFPSNHTNCPGSTFHGRSKIPGSFQSTSHLECSHHRENSCAALLEWHVVKNRVPPPVDSPKCTLTQFPLSSHLCFLSSRFQLPSNPKPLSCFQLSIHPMIMRGELDDVAGTPVPRLQYAAPARSLLEALKLSFPPMRSAIEMSMWLGENLGLRILEVEREEGRS